jgi:hypothetical protein
VVDARSTFAIRTVKSRGPFPLDHLGDQDGTRGAAVRRSG